MASPETIHGAGRPADGGARKRPSWQFVRLAALVVVAVLVVVFVALPRSGGSGAGGASRAPGPTFNLPAALDAQIDDAGLIRSGGVWAVQGSYLLTSTDSGESWRAGVVPAPAASVFVLDQDHAWAAVPASAVTSVGPGLVSGPVATSRPFVVARTADGGTTWGLAAVPGSFGCEAQSFSFVDANRGFLLCSESGAGTVLLTEDGGATWAIQGRTAGLGSQFTASDATTLWAAPGFGASGVGAAGSGAAGSGAAGSGAAGLATATLQVSRDAGRSWSAVDLPELSSVAAGSSVSVAAGPVFRDVSNGAIAIGVAPPGSGAPAVWFYRTVDAGKSWTVVKRSRNLPLHADAANALVGREWAVLADDAFGGLTVSGDFGATWRDVPAYGLPANGQLGWVDFTDPDHGVGWVGTGGGAGPGRSLMVSSDGGAIWHAADFGDARAKVGPNAAQDPVAAGAMARRFAAASSSEPQSAWRMLSSYSQRTFGGYSAFEAAQGALYKRVDHTFQIGQPTQSVEVRNRVSLGAALWDDMDTFADMSRAYVVVVGFAGTSEPPVTLVVAPLSITGDWRVWVATTS